MSSESWLASIRTRRWVFTHGWEFRHKEGIQRHAEVIREYFRPIPRHADASRQVAQQARGDGHVLVGLHIRQGDYARFLQGRYFYSPSQYLSFMHRLVELLADQRVSFLVCSDAPQTADNFPGLRVSFGSGHVVEDMYAFSHCDYLLGPPSTFTGWASFYGDVPLYQVDDPNQPFTLEDFKIWE